MCDPFPGTPFYRCKDPLHVLGAPKKLEIPFFPFFALITANPVILACCCLDGLTDCLDPDCCVSISCRDSVHCGTAPDPMEILLRKQPPSNSASFYDRMRFLVEEESVQSYATISSFNQT